MSRDVNIELLKALIKTKAAPTNVGICGNVNKNIQTHSIRYGDYLTSLFMSWPKFSGVSAYPVPHPDYESANCAYNATEMMWEGEYGALRMELLDFCITELEDQLEVPFESCVRADTVELEFSAPFSTFMIVSNFNRDEPCAVWCMGWEL